MLTLVTFYFMVSVSKPPATPTQSFKNICSSLLAKVVRKERKEKMTEPNNKTSPSWKDIVDRFDLQPLEPEGGYFRQTYKKPSESPIEVQEDRKPQATAILYLITGSNFSAWHRVPHDETFHFYSGNSVELIMINANGDLQVVSLGPDILTGEVPQYVVPGGTWQALRIKTPKSKDSWSLMGTTMAPGFDFNEFDLGDRAALLREFPQHANIIEELTRE